MALNLWIAALGYHTLEWSSVVSGQLLGWSERDKARMDELAVRNQEDDLTPDEKKEMHDFGKAATVRSILKSKARRSLGVKLKTRGVS